MMTSAPLADDRFHFPQPHGSKLASLVHCSEHSRKRYFAEIENKIVLIERNCFHFPGARRFSAT